MKIKNISTENFKSFSKLNELKLTQINMVYGFNNSGKSNLLKLIEIIFRGKINPESITKAVIDDRVESHVSLTEGKFWVGLIEDEPFIFRLNDRSKPITFTCLVELDETELESLDNTRDLLKKYFPPISAKLFEIEFSGDIISINEYDSKMRLNFVKFNGKEIFSDGTYFPSLQPTDELHENVEAFESIMGLMNNSVKFLDNDRYFISEKEDLQNRTLSSKNLKNWLFNLSLDVFHKDEYTTLIELLSTFKTSGDKVFKDNEKSSPFNELKLEFARLEKEKIEIFFINEFNRYPISSYGTGIQQIFFILLTIFFSKARVILIEEIELNLSPKYQVELLDFINSLFSKDKKLNQLIFSTHSPLFCYRGDFNILNVKINDRGETEIIKVKREDIDDFMDLKKIMMQES